MDTAKTKMREMGLPLIIRPSFTLGGSGGGIAYNPDEFEEIVRGGLDASPIGEVLVEQSVLEEMLVLLATAGQPPCRFEHRAHWPFERSNEPSLQGQRSDPRA